MNTKTRFTPGPWHVDKGFVCDESGVRIADCEPWPVSSAHGSPEVAQANAQLIAAVHDLVEALKVLADVAEARGIPVDAARAALARAISKS